MTRLLTRLADLLASLRWAIIPLGLFALLAVGAHAGAGVVADWMLRGLDWLDGQADRALASTISAWGEMLRASPESIDRWVFNAISLVDLREREWLARTFAVLLELWADWVFAVPALGYRDRFFVPKRQTAKEARLAELLRQKGFGPDRLERPGVRAALEATLHDPTLLRVALPVGTALLALAGAYRVAIEAQSGTFQLTAGLLGAGAAGSLGRTLGLVVVLGALGSLAARALAQSVVFAHARVRGEPGDKKRRIRRRFDRALALALAAPPVIAAADAAPLLSFFR